MRFGTLGRFGVVSAVALGLFGGTASAQPVVVVPAGPPAVAFPSYSPGYSFGGTLSVPGLTISGGVGPRVYAPVVPVVPPPAVRYPYPVYGRPYYYPPYHHHHHHW